MGCDCAGAKPPPLCSPLDSVVIGEDDICPNVVLAWSNICLLLAGCTPSLAQSIFGWKNLKLDPAPSTAPCSALFITSLSLTPGPIPGTTTFPTPASPNVLNSSFVASI